MSASACSVSLDPSAAANIICNSNAECPGDLVCLTETRRCVSPTSACVTQNDGAYHAAPNGTACALSGASGICNGGLCGLCGNGRLESGEVCDDGADNRDEPNHCSTHCELSACGDMIVTAGAESCDDGNANSNDACANCRAVGWSSALAFGLGPNKGGTTRRVISDVTGLAAANDGSIYITQNAPSVSVDRGTYQQGFVLRVSQSAQALLRVAGTEHNISGRRAATSIARETSLQALNGIAVDPRGTIYISEYEPTSVTPYVHSIDTQGVLRIVAGNGKLCSNSTYCYGNLCEDEPCGDGGLARAAALRGPAALAFDQTGELYFVDGTTVRVISADGYIRTVAGNSARCLLRSDCPYQANAQATSVSLGVVKGIAFSATNDLLLGIFYNGTDDAIDRVHSGLIEHQLTGVQNLGPLVGTLDGKVIFAAESGDGILFSYDAGQKKAQSILPTKETVIPGLSVAADGSVVFVDSSGRSVRRLNNGVVTDVFVSPAETAVFTGVLATSTEIAATAGAFADNGDLYVSTADRVFVRHATSGILDAVSSSVVFNGVTDLAWDGRLFVADQQGRRVYALVDGVATVIAGNGGSEPSTAAADSADATTLALEPLGIDVRNGVLTMTTRYAVWQVNLANGAAHRVVGTSFGSPLGCPSDVASDTNGDLYVADTRNCRIVRVRNGVSSDYVTTSSCANSGEPLASALCSVDSVGNFTPANLAISGTTLYLSDVTLAPYASIRSVPTVSTASVDCSATTLIAGARDAPSSYDDAPALATVLEAPRVLLDRNGKTYVLQSSSGNLFTRSIMRLTDDDALVTFVGNSDPNLTGPFAVAAMSSPSQAVQIDAATVIIADAEDGGLHRVDLNAEAVDMVYGNTLGDGTIPFARYGPLFGRASAVAYNPVAQRLYLGGTDGIYIIDTSGTSDPATWPYSSSDGTPFNALAYDRASDTLYSCDAVHHAVGRRNSALGSTAVVAGRYGFVGYNGDGGAGVAALLDTPLDIVVSSKGSLYIADSGNQRVRRVDAAGVISTVIGVGTATNSADDPTLPAALHSISQPQGLAFDAFGNLVVAGRGIVRVVLADGESGEPDGSSHVTTIFASDTQNHDLTQCMKTLFKGRTDAEIFAGDACSGAVFRLTRQAAP